MRKALAICAVVLALVVLSGCAVSDEDLAAAVAIEMAPAVAGTLAALPTATPYPTLTPYPTPTPVPTYTAQPTYTPQPVPTAKTILVTNTPTPMPVEFFSLEGSGSLVSDNYEWQRCSKAVFEWGALGGGNIIVRLCNAGSDECHLQINEIGPMEGEFLQPLLGGAYYWYVERGPQAGWWIKGTCRD